MSAKSQTIELLKSADKEWSVELKQYELLKVIAYNLSLIADELKENNKNV